MKKLKAILCALLVLAALLSITCAALAEDGYTDYYIAPLGLTVGIPDGVRVLTRDMDKRDPNLQGLDITASQLTYLMTVDHQYLDATGSDQDWGLQVYAYERGSFQVFDDSVSDFSEYGSWFRGQILDDLNESNAPKIFELVKVGGTPFYVCDEVSDGILWRSYLSVVGDYEVCMWFYAQPDDLKAVEPIWNDLLDRMTFAPITVDDKPAEEAHAEDTGPILYAPEGEEFTIELPAGLYVLWFGMEEDDLALERLGKTRGMVFAELRGYGNCMDVISPRLDWEMVVSTEASEAIQWYGDAALLDENSFEPLFQSYAEYEIGYFTEYRSAEWDSVTVEKSDSLMIGDYRFYRIQLRCEDEDYYDLTTWYFTAYGGRFYSFTFYGAGLSRSEQKALLSTVRFTAEPIGTTAPFFPSVIDWDAVRSRLIRDGITYAAAGALGGVIVGVCAVRKKKKAAVAAKAEAAEQDKEDPS